MTDNMKNSEGYIDLTAGEAIKNVNAEANAELRFRKLLGIIFAICELTGYHIEGRITIRDKKTGKLWE